MNQRRKQQWFGVLDWVLIVLVLIFCSYVYYQLRYVLIYDWNWGKVLQFFAYRDAETGEWTGNILLAGLVATVRILVYTAILSIMIGLSVALRRVSQHLWLRMLARTYVELVWNTPPLVFLFIFYFFISAQLFPLLGLNAVAGWLASLDNGLVAFLMGEATLIENMVIGVICLSLFKGAYVSEIIRAGIESIGRDQREGARSVDLTRVQEMRYVVLPQALRKVVPALVGQLITLIKDTSIISIISIQELTFSAQEVAVSTNRVFEVWIIVAAIYFYICYLLSVLSRRLELDQSKAR